jgi:hypothetical protein
LTLPVPLAAHWQWSFIRQWSAVPLAVLCCQCTGKPKKFEVVVAPRNKSETTQKEIGVGITEKRLK